MDNKSYLFKIEENEFWYGPRVSDGQVYPFSQDTRYEVSIDPDASGNQVNPLMLSTKGRYIWCNSGFNLKIYDCKIEIITSKDEPKLVHAGGTLKEAFLHASENYFKSNGVVPPKEFFLKPQYNTWIELLYNQNQEDILDYARNVIDKGMPVGIIMIDDGWSDYYGKWDFNREKFPDPKKMIDELHRLGFRVMLWSCPFISPDSLEFRQLKDKGYLVRNQDGTPAIKEWWNGFSGVLDMTNPDAAQWYHEQNIRLMDTYGVDGFKFDAGDAGFYSDEDLTYEKVDANGHSQIWAEFGLRYEYNEYRACFKGAGLPLVQRLSDKAHSWGGNGVAALIPNQLAQGILGYAYTCPDMIGGGEYMNFTQNAHHLDQELFVRYAQCAALMPMMQFSAAPWRVLSEYHFNLCNEAAWIHVGFADYIEALAIHAGETGEPIVRYMEYEFPNQGYHHLKDQFMLGNKYLIAPVVQKDAREREVYFPEGQWKDGQDTIIIGPKKMIVEASLEKILIFERV